MIKNLIAPSRVSQKPPCAALPGLGGRNLPAEAGSPGGAQAQQQLPRLGQAPHRAAGGCLVVMLGTAEPGAPPSICPRPPLAKGSVIQVVSEGLGVLPHLPDNWTGTRTPRSAGVAEALLPPQCEICSPETWRQNCPGGTDSVAPLPAQPAPTGTTPGTACSYRQRQRLIPQVSVAKPAACSALLLLDFAHQRLPARQMWLASCEHAPWL